MGRGAQLEKVPLIITFLPPPSHLNTVGSIVSSIPVGICDPSERVAARFLGTPISFS